jgi:hypothetical protein
MGMISGVVGGTAHPSVPRRVEATLLMLEASFFVVTATWSMLSIAVDGLSPGDVVLRVFAGAFGLVLALCVLHAVAAYVLWRSGERPRLAGRVAVYAALALQVPAAVVGLLALVNVEDGAANFLYGSFGVLATLAVLAGMWMLADNSRR